jgi:hypothetical protein
MATKAGMDLAAVLQQRVTELEDACTGLRETATGARPTPGEWSVREHLSHLYGDDRETYLHNLQRVVLEGVRELDIPSGITHYSVDRRDYPFVALVEAVAEQYRAIGDLTADLSEEQLGQHVRVEQLRNTRFGPEPTVGQMLVAIADSHLPQHITAIREARAALGA